MGKEVGEIIISILEPLASVAANLPWVGCIGSAVVKVIQTIRESEQLKSMCGSLETKVFISGQSLVQAKEVLAKYEEGAPCPAALQSYDEILMEANAFLRDYACMGRIDRMLRRVGIERRLVEIEKEVDAYTSHITQLFVIKVIIRSSG